jgi:hypothetical protein
MEKPPKVIYREPVEGLVFFELEEAKNGLVDTSTDTLFRLLKDNNRDFTKSASAILELRQDVIKAARTLITVLNDPEKLLTEYTPNGKA